LATAINSFNKAFTLVKQILIKIYYPLKNTGQL